VESAFSAGDRIYITVKPHSVVSNVEYTIPMVAGYGDYASPGPTFPFAGLGTCIIPADVDDYDIAIDTILTNTSDTGILSYIVLS
jgi:hypothetical protein